MSQISFLDFKFPQPLNLALTKMEYSTPTPVQAEAIPQALEGHDLLVTAQTGTGKTAAFALPLLAKILSGSKATVLVLAPTRELAEQINKVIIQLLSTSHHLKTALVIGGTGYHHQTRALRARPAFIIGTPGRIIDQIKQGNIKTQFLHSLVIDEADRLLDMGFEPQLEEIIAQLPTERQTLLFSATLPKEIEALANRYMKSPVRIAIGETSKPVEKIEQEIVETHPREKNATLIREIDKVAGTLIIFTRTKDRAEMVTRILGEAGHEAAYLHGDLSQRQRSNTIEGFRRGEFRILVATDIAARGLDIPHIRHVVNYDLPQVPEDFVHRIGRTARNGAEGRALTFVTPEDFHLWSRIHRLMHGFAPQRKFRQEDRAHDKKFRGPSSSFAPPRRGPAPAGRAGHAKFSDAKPTLERRAKPAPGKEKQNEFKTAEPRATKPAPYPAAPPSGLNRAQRRAQQFGTKPFRTPKEDVAQPPAPAAVKSAPAKVAPKLESKPRRASASFGDKPPQRQERDFSTKRSEHSERGAWSPSRAFNKEDRPTFHRERTGEERGPARAGFRPRRDEGNSERPAFRSARPDGERGPRRERPEGSRRLLAKKPRSGSRFSQEAKSWV